MTIPDSVISIGGSAFFGCAESLYTKVGGVIYVDKWAIDVVNSTIVSANIKSGTRGIAGFAFNECDSLTSVTIPNSVISIGNSAFYKCGSLMSLTIPSSVTSIGWFAFEYCNSLTSVAFNGTIAQWKAVEKGSSWRYGVKATVIKCSDGDVSIDD